MKQEFFRLAAPSPRLMALIADARPAPGSDEAYFLAQLRAAMERAADPAGRPAAP